MKCEIGRVVLCAVLAAGAGTAQVCTSGVQLQNDSLPANPAGQQNVAVIAGICVGDRAGAVFGLGAYPGPVNVVRAGILFAGPPGSVAATGVLQIHDGIAIAANGAATPGPVVYTHPMPVSYQPNALTVVDFSGANVLVSSGQLVVSFSLTANPNEAFPGFGCILGYTASFASDTGLAPGSPCATAPGTNLIYDPAQGWWDVTGFQISGQSWCGQAFNGNWVIRACIVPPSLPAAFPGTGEDLVLLSSVGGAPPGQADLATALAGEIYNLAVQSPGGTFAGAPLVLVADVFPTGMPPSPLFPGVRVGAGFSVVIGGPTGPLGQPVVPAGGFAISFAVPAGLSGVSVMFQGAAIAFFAANGAFATTNAHVVDLL